MKLKCVIATLALSVLAGCGSMRVTTTDPTTGTTTTTIDVSKGQLQIALASDFERSAKYAERGCNIDPIKNNPNACFPDRAAVLRANAALLHAVEGQASSCINAIRASLIPDVPDAPADAGPILRLEMFNERIAGVKLMSPVALIICKNIPVAAVPSMPTP